MENKIHGAIDKDRSSSIVRRQQMKTRHSNRPAMSLLSAGMLLTALSYSVPAYAAETSRYAGGSGTVGDPWQIETV